MKRKAKRHVTSSIVLSLLTSTLLHATNGDQLISMGTKARGMGGAGIGVSHCAESTLHNPALITCTKGTSITFGGTVFMPDVSTQLGTFPEFESDADINIIPSISITHKIDENWFLGIGMWGTAGMGVDYRDAAGNMNMVTNLQLMQFGISAAYKVNGLSLAVTPILQYGSLDINFNMPDMTAGTNPPPMIPFGTGVAQDLAVGVNLGVSYDFSNGFTVGAVYKSAIEMEYKGQLSTATTPFAGVFGGTLADKLEQPAEIGVGIGYKLDNHRVAFDYKKIQWSNAKGYEEFGWSDQDVYAAGYEYYRENWVLRLGYNYASSAVEEIPETGNGIGSTLNFFNLLGFPATAERHVTVGGSYTFTDAFAVDLAYVHALENTETFATPAYADMGIDSITTNHDQDSVSFQLTYKF